MTISVVCDISALELSFDIHRMEQVFNNLISNAVKYASPGTDIVISVEVNKKKREVITKIADNGPGMFQEELAKVFDKYFTTGQDLSGNEKSVGLGLAIVKKIIESHGGKIGVNSTKDEGSAFYFSLPLR